MHVDFSYFFVQISWQEHLQAERKVVGTERPSRHIRRGPGAIRALWSAWKALKVFLWECVRPIPWFQYERSYIVPGTYVPVKSRRLFALSRAHSPDIEPLTDISFSERARLVHPWPLRAPPWEPPPFITWRTFPAVLCSLFFS